MACPPNGGDENSHHAQNSHLAHFGFQERIKKQKIILIKLDKILKILYFSKNLKIFYEISEH